MKWVKALLRLVCLVSAEHAVINGPIEPASNETLSQAHTYFGRWELRCKGAKISIPMLQAKCRAHTIL
ncbi:MAG: hypothetical protein J0H54_10710, partial [Rhizobiales bacterium]|nr:hypothetical protein [Hyphomicrobiales bacterium]